MDGTLNTLREELEGALEGLDERQTQLRPLGDQTKWNVQQIAGHLRLTYAVTIEAMDARIAKGAPTKAKPSLVQRVAQTALIGMGYFPRGRTAPERVTCAGDQPVASGDVLIEAVRIEL